MNWLALQLPLVNWKLSIDYLKLKSYRVLIVYVLKTDKLKWSTHLLIYCGSMIDYSDGSRGEVLRITVGRTILMSIRVAGHQYSLYTTLPYLVPVLMDAGAYPGIEKGGCQRVWAWKSPTGVQGQSLGRTSVSWWYSENYTTVMSDVISSIRQKAKQYLSTVNYSWWFYT